MNKADIRTFVGADAAIGIIVVLVLLLLLLIILLIIVIYLCR